MPIMAPKSSVRRIIFLATFLATLTIGISPSLSGSALAQDATPPLRPTGLTIIEEGRYSVSISWDDPQDDSIAGYQILRRSRDGGTYGDGQGAAEFVAVEDDTGTADTEYSDESVTPETRYVYRVKARNPAGLSERSSYANAETPAAPEITPEPTPEKTPEPTPKPTPPEHQGVHGNTGRGTQTSSDTALTSITVNGVAVPGVAPDTTGYSFGVGHLVDSATLVAEPSHAEAVVSFRGLHFTDADDTTDGHQVDLVVGPNIIEFTVTAQDGTTTGDYTLTINRGSNAATGWTVLKDLDDLLGSGGEFPGGIWSDESHIWVSGGDDLKLYAYMLANEERDADRDIALHSDNAAPKGIWSDGETMWVVDSADGALYAYNLQSGERDSAKDYTDLGDDDADYYGIWSDGETIWLSNKTGPVIEAFDMDTGDKVPALRYTHLEDSAHDHVAGIWSDGGTMLVVSTATGREYIWGYHSPQAGIDLNRNLHYFNLSGSGNLNPGAIWADGETLWVSDTADGKIYTYNLRASADTGLSSITVDGEPASGVDPGATEFLLRVANSTGRVTLAAAPRHPNAAVSYNNSDADSDLEGHQVDLRVGGNTITITVVAEDGITTAYHTLTINRASSALSDWAVLPDLENVLGSGSEYPEGMWSDGTLIWVSGGDDQKLYAYVLATGERKAERDISLHTDNGDPKGIWSNSTTMWVLDGADRKLYAYNLDSGARDDAEDFGTFGDEDDDYYGVWSDGETVWLSNGNYTVMNNVGTAAIEAYDFDSGNRVSTLDYTAMEPSGQDHVAGIWSDGVTMWAVDPERKMIFAYGSPTDELDQGRDFRRLIAAGNESPRDIWSDGETMWVSDSVDGKIYSYNMPVSNDVELRSLIAAGRKVYGFEPDIHTYTLGVWSTASQVAVQAYPRQRFATVSFTPEDSAPNLSGYQMDPETGANTVTITVLAQDGVTQGTYTVHINRANPDPFGWRTVDDFDSLHLTGNDSPGGLASDGSTMWVADEVDLKLYAYDMQTEARTADRDITLDLQQGSPGGVWTDGTTIWVYDVEDRKLYAYAAETGARDEGKDIDRPEDMFPIHYGVWSNGDTMWLSQQTGGLAAYDLGTGTRDGEKDFDALDGVDGIDVRGIWSDGVTMWVVDSANQRLRALNLSTGEPDTDKDFHTVRNAETGSIWGIWSDGETMWVSDSAADKVYSYNMPALDSTHLRKVLVDGQEASGSTLEGKWYATIGSAATEATVASAAAQLKATASLGGTDNDTVADGHQFSIPDLTADMTITVTAQSGDTRAHTLTVSRVNTASAQKVRVRSSVTGDVVSPEEFDVVAVDLVTDELYRFDLEGIDNGDGVLANPRLLGLLKLVHGVAVPVGDTEDFLRGHGTNSSEVYHEPKPEGQGPATKATYYIVVGSESGSSGGYRLSVSYEDEATADTSTTAVATVLPSSKSSGKRGRYHYRGAIGEPGDVDWIKVTLEAEQMYRIVMKSATTGNYRTVAEPILLGLYTGDGTVNYIRGTLAAPYGHRFEARIHYYAESAGVYYVSLSGFGDDTGSYDLLVMAVEDDCQPDNASTHDTIAVGGDKNGKIDYRGDTDWFRTELTGGTTYTIEASQGEGKRPLPGPTFLIYDTGARRVSAGESTSSGTRAVASYTPDEDGTYYIAMMSRVGWTGTYRLSLSD